MSLFRQQAGILFDGEIKDGKKEDDTIGAIHDRLAKIEKMLEEHLITKKEANEEETKKKDSFQNITAH